MRNAENKDENIEEDSCNSYTCDGGIGLEHSKLMVVSNSSLRTPTTPPAHHHHHHHSMSTSLVIVDMVMISILAPKCDCTDWNGVT